MFSLLLTQNYLTNYVCVCNSPTQPSLCRHALFRECMSPVQMGQCDSCICCRCWVLKCRLAHIWRRDLPPLAKLGWCLVLNLWWSANYLFSLTLQWENFLCWYAIWMMIGCITWADQLFFTFPCRSNVAHLPRLGSCSKRWLIVCTIHWETEWEKTLINPIMAHDLRSSIL